MPTYVYKCNQGHVYERKEGYDASAVQTCPQCGEEARRLLSPPTIVMKGPGAALPNPYHAEVARAGLRDIARSNTRPED